ncbi:MAG: SDR family oxidoreductase [Chloroflexi bacterium]|nr:MAG: SDR family oxidoreductase [Chloroflexota bacterium]
MGAGPAMRWLLLGASGLVGTHLRRALMGRDVVMTSHRTPLEGSVSLDLANGAATDRAVSEARPDVVVVAAANAFVEGCERDPAATRALNVDAVRRVAEAAPRALLVVFSSEYVFDGAAGPYAEDDVVAPINEYGRQKVALEQIARERNDHLVCRVSGVYGWSAARTSFVAQLVDRLRAGQRFRVPADQLITPTPAPDLANAIVELVDRGARGTFHAAGPEILDRPDFARRAAAAFGLDAAMLDFVPTAQLGLAAQRPLRAGLRTEKLRRFLGHGLAHAGKGLEAMRDAEPSR